MFRLFGILGIVVLSAMYGAYYDIRAVSSTLMGHRWDPYNPTPAPSAAPRVVAGHWNGGYVIPITSPGPADLTMGHAFTLKTAGIMLSFSAFSYELKYVGVSDLRNGPAGSKLVTMHYYCSDAAYNHSREYAGTVSYVRAEIEGGWLQSNLMPLRLACR